MRVDALAVGTFDGSRRQIIGEIDLPIWVGPHLFTITLQVVDINSTCISILGGP